MFIFGLGSIIMLFVAFVMVNLALVIYIGSKELPAKLFAFATLVSVVWVMSTMFTTASPEGSVWLGDFLVRSSYTAGLFVALSYSYFCVVFVKMRHDVVIGSIYLVLAFVCTYVLMFTHILVGDGFWRGEISKLNIQIWGPEPGMLPFVYDILFVGFFVGGLMYMYIASKKEQEKERVVRLRFMFWTVLIGMIPPAFFSILLQNFGIYQYDWLSVLSMVFWMGIVAYSIFKVRQLHVKILTTELLILALLFILFIALFV